eukprot:3085283-Prymnesium_polylepis.2
MSRACDLIVAAHESMIAGCFWRCFVLDRMPVGYRCSSPLMPCDGGAHDFHCNYRLPPRRRGARDMAWGVWGEGRVLSRGCTEGRGAVLGRCR